MQACGPKVKDIRFASPGCFEAVVGRSSHRSGLQDFELDFVVIGELMCDLPEDFRVVPPYVFIIV